MQNYTNNRDLKTLGIVLRRTNYGEADRILNIITPVGKVSTIAKGVRKSRSKLAGGVEMFTLSELIIHQGRSEMGVVTSARMVKHYDEIIKNYEKMELAGFVLKGISKYAEHTNSDGWFKITQQSLEGINDGMDLLLVKEWFILNLMLTSGEEVNLYRDSDGERLAEEMNYDWDMYEKVFKKNENGEYGADEIKLMRLMTKMDLNAIKRVRIEPDVINKVYDIIKIWEN